MRWIQTGRQLGQAVKNVQRMRQIIGVFAHHGFADVIDRMNLGKYLPRRLAVVAEAKTEKSVPVRLRECFEKLGPTFVKFGQLLSTRPDIVPDAFIEEFTRLQDQVQPVPYEAIRAVIEEQLDKPVSEAFASFSETPLASASIAQVHEARLHTGERVVVKVQRPEIQKLIDTDISLLAFLSRLLEKYVPESRVFNPTTIVDEFFRTLAYELDFVVEANNIIKIAHNMESIPEIVIPKVYKSLSSQRVLTLEKLEGIRVNDLKALDAAGVDKKQVVRTGARAFFKSVMIDGLFHGDLHGGNLFILPGDRLGIIDFGIVGRLSQKARDQLASMVMSLLTEDYESLCYQYAELGAADPSIDFDAFQREIRNTISPYVGLSISELNSGRVLIEATKIAAKFNIRVPGDWMIVFKAILTIEGMGRTLDPSFDFLAMGQELVKDLVKSQYSKQRLVRDFAIVAKDIGSLLQVLPRQIRWMFKKFNRNDFAFEIKSPDLSAIRDQLEANGKRSSLSLIVSSLFIACAIALQYSGDFQIAGFPAVSVTLFGLALVFLLRLWTL